MEFSLTGRDTHRTKRLLVVFQGLVVTAVVMLLVAFWHFQIGQHTRLLVMAENNHQRQTALRAPRGVVFDRDGRILVENRHSLTISLIPEQVSDLHRTVALLAKVTGIDEWVIRQSIDQHDAVHGQRSITVIEDASMEQVAAVSARKMELPAVVIEQKPRRHYVADNLGAHLFGYIGEITGSQLLLDRFNGRKSGDIVGQSGIELTYNSLLAGTDGVRHVTVDSVGREIKAVGEIKPSEGYQVQLTLDHDLQRATEAAFELAGFAGASIVLDPQTGEVLSLVSLPAYDPNAFATGIDYDDWMSLNRDRLRPLQNRALQGLYSPGSTFKIAVAITALEEGVIDANFKVACHGGGTFYGRFFRCHTRHGTVALAEAIEKSCNTYFYELGRRLDVDQIHKWSTALGLGAPSGIDLPHEVRGLIPSQKWKQETVGERWYPGETISVAIGQGQVSVTPISLAVMMATVANGGRRVVPQLLKAYNDGTGWHPKLPPESASLVRMSPKTVETVMRSLWMVVNREGTGRRGRVAGRDVVGKTGTAQVISLSGREAAVQTDRDLRDHGWFVFAAPRNNPQIAGAVFGEHSEHGYLVAPIARHVIDTFFAKKEGRPLPTIPIPSREIHVEPVVPTVLPEETEMPGV